MDLGTGRLSWSRYERIGDRYGSVKLFAAEVALPWPKYIPHGQLGRLSARVIETRESPHIGDLFRGLFPSTPDPGEEIVLGEGHLFVEGTGAPGDGSTAQGGLGCQPDDGRETDWLSPEALYRAHNQTVRLTWEPIPQ